MQFINYKRIALSFIDLEEWLLKTKCEKASTQKVRAIES